MADHHEGALVAGEPVFQPFDGGQIEVVGRLVQQQQIGLAGQRPGRSRRAVVRRRWRCRPRGQVDAQLVGNRFAPRVGRALLRHAAQSPSACRSR